MKRRSLLRGGVAALIALPVNAGAQPASRLPRIGFLNNLNPSLASPSTEAFLQGLRELGWVEGKNVTIEYRWADGDMARHPALVAELVRMPVDLIVTAGDPAVRAARQATRTIPIVVTIMSDPVRLGFVTNLAHPGGNITGLANLFEELTPKQLQLFQEVLPKAKRIALISDRSMENSVKSATETAARANGLVPRVFQIGAATEVEGAILAAKNDHADGIIVLPSPVFNRYRRRIAELALQQKLPTCSESSEYVRDGGLLSYGPNFPHMYYRAASYVDRILKGAKPGDLPIERPIKFELVLNVATATALGITLPESLLLRADEVIR